MIARSPLRLSRKLLLWLCSSLAIVMFALAVTMSDGGNETTPPVMVAATLDFESSDFDAELPALRAGQSMPLAGSLGERHEGTHSVRPASRTPTPPDRPPRTA